MQRPSAAKLWQMPQPAALPISPALCLRVVPLDAQERAWREAVGRMSCELASQAETVVRMVCGIPVVLKGELA